MKHILGIYSSQQYHIQFPSVHKLCPNGDSPYETIISFENIEEDKIMGSIYIKSVKHLKWDRLLFAGQWSNDDEITLFTYSNHLFSGKYKLFFAFDQISVVYLSFHLDLKFDFTVKKESKSFELPSSNNIQDTINQQNSCSKCNHGCNECGV